MVCAFITFWVLLILGADELGLTRIVTTVIGWLAVTAGAMFVSQESLFIAGTALLDIVLVLAVFNGGSWIKPVRKRIPKASYMRRRKRAGMRHANRAVKSFTSPPRRLRPFRGQRASPHGASA